jgi:hypothetical protein
MYMKISIKSGLVLVLRIIGLGILLFACHSISGLLPVPNLDVQPIPAGLQAEMGLVWLGICFLNALVMAYPIWRSAWHGWKLMLAVAAIYFGISSFLSQIESLVFLRYLTYKMTVPTIMMFLLQGMIAACLFAPLAVLVMGKMRAPGSSQVNRRLDMPWTQWLGKLVVITVCYYVIYFSFGFLVAWQSPAVRAFYAGMNPPLWLIPLLQVGRGLIWAGLAVLVIELMKGEWWEAGLATALLFSVLMSSVLLLPYNQFMPQEVAAAHFKEILSSNFIFGWFVVWVLNVGKRIGTVGRLGGVRVNG